uniref:DUF4283 domain-containing protein n=1 Tax=Cannabis sativa TaxID=3483 RepID=A0A803Q0G9_CANSA
MIRTSGSEEQPNSDSDDQSPNGVNPPLHILEGFVNMIWKDKVDRVKMLSYGIFIIRFSSMEYRDKILNGGYIFFNMRPIIMKPWDPNVNFKKEDVQCVPIWIQLEDLELKYWSQRSLLKIVGQLGKPLMVDSVTKEMENELPQSTSRGHIAANCKRSTTGKQQWVIKQDNRNQVQIDEEGFMKVFKARKIDGKGKSVTDMNSAVNSTVVRNSFQALDVEESANDAGENLMDDRIKIGGGPLSNG